MVARIALVVIGLILWGYGVRVGDAQLRLIGIVLLAASLVLRFVGRRGRDGNDGAGGDAGRPPRDEP